MTRHPDDFYPTPQVAVDELLDELIEEMADGCVFDPAAGDGALLAATQAKYPSLHLRGIELDPDRAQKAMDRIGFFNPVFYGDYLIEWDGGYWRDVGAAPALVISNPPYSLAQEFVTKMLNERGKDTIVAVLLRLGFLASQKRANWWRSIGPPSAIRVLSKRPSFTGDGKTDATDYCWMIWNPPGRGLGLAPIGWYAGGCDGD